MSRPIPPSIETFDALMVDDDGVESFAKIEPVTDMPGFAAMLAPFYHLADRGMFFTETAFDKSVKDKMKSPAAGKMPHLHQHWHDAVIGMYTALEVTDKGLMTQVAINEETQLGREVLSNMRMGVPYGQSIGFDRIATRPGNADDEKKLNRKSANGLYMDTPIDQLTAVTEARIWEGSTVAFGAISTAKPVQIWNAAGQSVDIADILRAFKDGDLTVTQLDALAELVAAYEAKAEADRQHLASETRQRLERASEIELTVNKYADLIAL